MMKIVTFNIRCDYNQDGLNSFQYRKKAITYKIKKESPDIICFQEVLPHVAAWLKETLTDYHMAGCGRSETLEDEQETIAYKKARFDLVAMDSFWLSETPYIPGSRYEEQSICPRVTTEAVLQDLESGKLVRVVNTHLDHQGIKARELGLKQIMEKITNASRFSKAPVILAGDFNAEPEMPEMDIMKAYPDFKDATASVGGTFHDFETMEKKEKIDYIFIQEPLCLKHAEKWTNCKEHVNLSDHYPVCVEIYSN